MNDAAVHIANWVSADAGSWAPIVAPALIGFSFLAFNAIRVALQVREINAWTWSSWIVASLSNALYMGVLLGDVWGLALNLANALMCAATVVIAHIRRRRRASAAVQQPHRRVRSAGVVFYPR